MADFELVDRDILLDRILPFLASANSRGERVVFHCAGGIGRTGQVLAAWLVISIPVVSSGDLTAKARSTRRKRRESLIQDSEERILYQRARIF
ncbi:hypothetical protein [Microcoleus anatoxicus]|uniref:Tyrosine specific protein phosphatases domain-containing protein n=1 Tax=Microcoleus anatoxicus PTRS2 TaxID=2705321 RepID=A0ABU8YLY3_9CYAN